MLLSILFIHLPQILEIKETNIFNTKYITEQKNKTTLQKYIYFCFLLEKEYQYSKYY